MDPEEHREPNNSDHGADNAMQVEASSDPDTIPVSNEIEMLAPEDNTGSTSAGGISAHGTQLPPINISAPTSLTGAPSNETLPPISSITQRTSLRRTRVEDDHDDERDRRHPSARLSSPSHPTNTAQPSSASSSQPTSSPAASRLHDILSSNAPRSPPSNNSRLNPFHFFRHIMPHRHSNNSNRSSQSTPHSEQQGGTTAGPSSGPAPIPAAAAPPSNNNPTSASEGGRGQQANPRANARHQYLGGFTITIDVNGGMTTTPLPGTPPVPATPNTNAVPENAPFPSGPIPGLVPLAPEASAPMENGSSTADQREPQNSAQPQPQPQPQPQAPPTQAQADPQSPPGNASDGAAAFADILARIGLLAALSFRDSALFERDVDDPERAKKLVEGLEDVPVGLVRRLERVGKTSEGEGQSPETAEGGLGDGGCAICWERLLIENDEPKEEGSSEKDAKTSTEPSTHEEATSSAPVPEASSSKLEPSTEDSEPEKQYQRIVTLPCAHVFHAQCLIPWFSKPKQTTCPICRFNIDPENLTYNSRAQRARSRTQAEQQNADGGEDADILRDGGAGDVEDAGIGLDIPMMFGGGGGEPPIIIPLGGGAFDRDVPQDAVPPPPGAEPQVPTDNAENADPNANANQNRANNGDIVTIGFDMYIGRGPPPFPMGGPNVFQIPIPGRNGAANNAQPNPPDAPTATGEPAPGTNAASANAQATPDNANANSQPGTGNADTRGPPGTTFAIPIPMGPGIGRAIGDMLTRIITAGAAGGMGAGGTAPTTAGSQPGATQPQGPVMFGPERPPTMSGPGVSIPGGVGLGLGMGPIGGAGMQSMPIPPFVLPFGNSRPTTGSGVGPGPAGAGGFGGAGAGARYGGAQGPMGAGPEALFDIVSGLFGGPPPMGQGQGQGPQTNTQPTTGANANANAHPAQPQPRRAQDEPAGLGFTWLPSGSPPPRPASAPAPRQQQQQQQRAERKKWTPPPPPGLTLRQRVEKREQEAGLRCCDVSCGVGPSDEDPWICVTEHGLKQLSIRESPSRSRVASPTPMKTVDSGVNVASGAEITQGDERKSVCQHTFHSSCLVSSERVALRDAEVSFVGPEGRKEVEVSCPVCRGVGRVSKEEWDAGVEALA